MQLLENHSVQNFPLGDGVYTGIYAANLRTNTIKCTLCTCIIYMCFHELDRHSIGFVAYLYVVIGVYM